MYKTLAVAGLLLCVLTLPQASYAITGCTNARLMGTYNAQVSSAGFMNVLNALNPTATGTTSSSGTAATNSQAGFGGNTNSLSGSMPGLGRYFFDGNGNIDGVAPGGNGFVTVGSYSVSDDCTATMKLNSGQTFNAILAEGGSRVLFIESDANGGGATGELDLSANACISGGTPRTFAFNFFGAQQVSATSGTGTGTGTGTPTTNAAFQSTSGIGTIALDGAGSFSLTQWVFAGGSVKQQTAKGTYTFGMNCALQLTYSPSNGATTGSVANNNFQGILLGSTNGALVMQTDQNDFVIGQLIGQ